jgi:DNA-binding transcriptional regulator YiaG
MDAETIKAAREREGDSITLAAGRIGVRERTWERWEAGESTPTGEAILRALRAYVEGERK